MKRFAFTLALFLFLIPVAGAQTGEDLFQQALRTERLSGNMEAAIALYEQVVEEHGEDRELSSRALLQLARAYESQGRTEARRAYGRLVSEYAEYPDVLAEARAGYERLSERLAEAQPGTTTGRTTPEDADSWGASLSHDGKLLVAPIWGDESGGGIVLQDLRTGVTRRIGMDMGEGERGGPEFTSLSPDGSTIAAGWYPGGRSRFATLRIADVESGEVTELVDALEYGERRYGVKLETANIQAHEWTADGKSILAYFALATEPDSTGKTWHQELVLVHRDGSTPTLVAEFGEEEPYGWEKTCITSDKRFVFAQFGAREAPFIERIELESGDRLTWRKSSLHGISLVGCPSNPDRVLFTDDLVGGKRLYSADPAVLHGPATLHAAVPEDSKFGLASRRGDVIFWPGRAARTLWAASLDPELFDLAEAPEKEAAAAVFGASWSPSRNVATWWDRTRDENILWNADAGVKSVLDLPPNTRVDMFSPFSADGGILKLNSATASLYYNLEEGQVTDSVSHSVFDALEGAGWRRGTNPEGREYAWHRGSECLLGLDMKTGAADQVWCLSNSPGPPYFFHTISPDHTQILIERGHNWGGDDVSNVRLELLDIADGTVRIILDQQTPGANGGYLGWASWIGNDALLVSERSRSNINDTISLSVLDLASGERRPVLQRFIDMFTPREVTVSHDRRYLLAVGSPNKVGEDMRQATIIHRAVEVRADQ